MVFGLVDDTHETKTCFCGTVLIKVKQTTDYLEKTNDCQFIFVYDCLFCTRPTILYNLVGSVRLSKLV